MVVEKNTRSAALGRWVNNYDIITHLSAAGGEGRGEGESRGRVFSRSQAPAWEYFFYP